jgi:hypothetical protein
MPTESQSLAELFAQTMLIAERRADTPAGQVIAAAPP